MDKLNITRAAGSSRLDKKLSLIAIATLLSGCGAASIPERSPSSNQQSSTSSPTPIVTYPTPTPSPTGGGLPPITSSFTLTGSSGSAPSYTFTVNTDSILKVQITAGAASNVIPGSNFSATYGCVSYSVTVLGQTVNTQTLGVNGGSSICPNAPQSQTIDFSARLTAGHQSVPITVKATGYDFYCQGCLTYPWLYNAYPYGMYSCAMYCPLHTVFQNHGVTGTMAVQVDGTTGL